MIKVKVDHLEPSRRASSTHLRPRLRSLNFQTPKGDMKHLVADIEARLDFYARTLRLGAVTHIWCIEAPGRRGGPANPSTADQQDAVL